jgi:hypothetical protein
MHFRLQIWVCRREKTEPAKVHNSHEHSQQQMRSILPKPTFIFSKNTEKVPISHGKNGD